MTLIKKKNLLKKLWNVSLMLLNKPEYSDLFLHFGSKLNQSLEEPKCMMLERRGQFQNRTRFMALMCYTIEQSTIETAMNLKPILLF